MYPIHFSCFLFSFHTFRSVLILFRLLYISIWFMAHLNQRSTKKSWKKKRPAKNKQQQYHEVAKQKLREENERRTIHVYVQKIRSVHRHSVVASLPSWSPVFFLFFFSFLHFLLFFFLFFLMHVFVCLFFRKFYWTANSNEMKRNQDMNQEVKKKCWIAISKTLLIIDIIFTWNFLIVSVTNFRVRLCIWAARLTTDTHSHSVLLLLQHNNCSYSMAMVLGHIPIHYLFVCTFVHFGVILRVTCT